MSAAVLFEKGYVEKGYVEKGYVEKGYVEAAALDHIIEADLGVE